MQRPSDGAPQKKGEWHCPDADWLSTYPVLSQGMSDRWWDDGKPREAWTVTIRFGIDDVHLSVTDHGLQRSLFTTAESVIEGLSQLEAVLSGGASSWRRWKGK